MKNLRVLFATALVLFGFAFLSFAATTYFQYSALSVSTSLSKPGELVEVFADVKNIGSVEGSSYANLFVDGILADTKQVTLGPGEAQRVSFSVSFSRVGMHNVSVANLSPEKVKTYDKPVDSSVLILRFEEGEGVLAKDESGFENHGYWIGNPSWVEGKFGTAIDTKEEDFIEIPSSASLDITGSTITMMIWFYPNQESGYSDFFTKGDHNVLKMQDPSTVNFFAGGWARGECMASVPENWDQNWHHVAGVCEGKILKLYIDGELSQTIEVAGSIGHTDSLWNIGRNADSPRGRATNGFLDEARIYFEALSQNDIREIMMEH